MAAVPAKIVQILQRLAFHVEETLKNFPDGSPAKVGSKLQYGRGHLTATNTAFLLSVEVEDSDTFGVYEIPPALVCTASTDLSNLDLMCLVSENGNKEIEGKDLRRLFTPQPSVRQITLDPKLLLQLAEAAIAADGMIELQVPEQFYQQINFAVDGKAAKLHGILMPMQTLKSGAKAIFERAYAHSKLAQSAVEVATSET